MAPVARLTLTMLLLGGMPASVLAAPTLPGGIIQDLRGLESALSEGQLGDVKRQAEQQAQRLEGGNASDRWARALYLQLAANAAVRQDKLAEAVAHLATARQIRGVDQAQADRWLRQEAGLRARMGQKARASELLADWLDRHSGDIAALWLMTQQQAEANAWSQAADWAQRALEADDAPSRQQLTLAATALQRAGREQQALAVLERQLAGAEDDPDAWRRAAGLAQRLGDAERAAALWETAWRQGVLSGADDLLQRIKLHLAAGTPARAAEILEQALSNGALDKTLEHQRLLAQAWYAAKDHRQALAAWQALAERSQSAEDWLRLGQIAAEWGSLDVARDALTRARDQGASEATQWLSSLPASRSADSAANQGESGAGQDS